MEIQGTRSVVNRLHVCFLEMVGTMFILISFNLSTKPGASVGQSQPVAVGFTVFLTTLFLGSLSGGHFNPAVSFAVLIKQRNFKTNLPFFVSIMASQIAGAVVGACIVWGFNSKDTVGTGTAPTLYPGISVLCPVEERSDGPVPHCDQASASGQIFLAETICTFIFVSVFYTVKFNHRPHDHILTSIVIGAAMFVSLAVAYGVSGGCLNPAVGLVQQSF